MSVTNTEIGNKFTQSFHRTVTAYHEGGHAVSAVRYGARLDWVHIKSNGIDAGVTKYLHKGNSMICKDPRLIRQSMTITLAGLAAQQRFMLEKGLPYEFDNSTPDCKAAIQLLKVQNHPPCTDDPFEFWEIYGKRAREFVRVPCNWTAITALANALLEQEYLTGQQAIDVIEEAQFEQAFACLIDSEEDMGIRDFEQTLRQQGFSKKRSLILISKIRQLFRKETVYNGSPIS